MSEPKPFASLSPRLLARKGGARPAMRPQVAQLFPDALARDLNEDLGWNDMGHEPGAGAEVVPLTGDQPQSAPVPDVVRQQERIAREVSAARRSALADGRRAAFTLRVDAERHLKLRLACTIRNRSAQQLVTEALDRLLDELPDLSALAQQVARNRKS